jgi:hypothetical protein
MLRRAARIGLAAAMPVPLLTLAILSGCRESSRPPMQTAAETASSDTIEAVEVKPPTEEERAVAKERLEKAIAAHGGPIRLRRLRSQVQKLKGKIHVPQTGQMEHNDQELRLKFPDKMRLDIKLYVEGVSQTISVGIDGDSGWSGAGPSVRDMTTEQYREVREEIYLRRVQSLLPLLDKDEFIIRPIDGSDVNGEKTVGVLVGAKDHFPVKLYFNEKNLLVRMLGPFREGGQVAERSMVFLGHKSFDEIIMPTQFIQKRAGLTQVDCQVEYKFPPDIDAKEFAKPKE